MPVAKGDSVDGLFKQLERKDFFVPFVIDFYQAVPKEVAPILGCQVEIDEGRIEYAHSEYVQRINQFSALLASANPDHYKRAGALLYSLYQGPRQIITNLNWEHSPDDLETGFGPVAVTKAEADEMLPFARFYDDYHNEQVAFDFCYRCCAAYDPSPRTYHFDYLHNLCWFMKEKPDTAPEAYWIIFKSLMQ